MSFTQLNPPLPLETSKGPGWAHFVIDYGQEFALLWVVFMDADGAAGPCRTTRSGCASTGPSDAGSLRLAPERPCRLFRRQRPSV